MSTMSSDILYSSTISEATAEMQAEGITSKPESIQIQTFKVLDISIHKSIRLIRGALLEKCEAVLANLIEFYTSQRGDFGGHPGDNSDVSTRNLCLTYDLFLQFSHFSSCSLGNDVGEKDVCGKLKNDLSTLMKRHLRSVYIEAMKTMGTLLSHESWQLAPLEMTVPANRKDGEEKVICAMYEVSDTFSFSLSFYHLSLTVAFSQAVEDLLLSSTGNEYKTDELQYVITSRAEGRGYLHCCSFRHYWENKSKLDVSPKLTQNDDLELIQSCFGIASSEFSSSIMPLIETNLRGERSVSILTQSAAGLVRWTARLLTIRNAYHWLLTMQLPL